MSAKEGALAFPLFSLSPPLFVSQAADADQLSVQPALVVGLVRDIINIGVGYNLTRPEAGRFFLLLGLGVGFKF